MVLTTFKKGKLKGQSLPNQLQTSTRREARAESRDKIIRSAEFIQDSSLSCGRLSRGLEATAVFVWNITLKAALMSSISSGVLSEPSTPGRAWNSVLWLCRPLFFTRRPLLQHSCGGFRVKLRRVLLCSALLAVWTCFSSRLRQLRRLNLKSVTVHLLQFYRILCWKITATNQKNLQSLICSFLDWVWQ